MEPAVFLKECLIQARIDGEGIRRFEERLGFPEGALREIINEEKSQIPRLDKAAKIAEALGLELYIGPPRPTDPNEAQTTLRLGPAEVVGFRTTYSDEGFVALEVETTKGSGRLALTPEAAKALGDQLIYRAMQIEEKG